MTKDEALKLALEHIEGNYTVSDEDAIAAIKEVLAQPEQIPPSVHSNTHQPEQEPVALPCCGYTDASAIKWNPYNQVVQCHNCGQVYTTPPQRTWVGLTKKEVHDLFHPDFEIFHQRIEAKLKEKNT